MNQAIVDLAIKETPALVAMFRELFAKDNPGVPQPTEPEIFAGFNAAFFSSMAKDDAWRAAHPEPPA